MTNQQASVRILVVEDDQHIRFAVSLLLETQGYEVILVSNGQEALEFLDRNPMPDLILLDMLMPVMDGWQFADQFRSRYNHQSPIVVMTAASDAAQRARDVRADGYVSKPFSLDAFLETVSSHLGAGRTRKSA